MNTIRQIKELNKRELEAGITPEGSWHADYRDTAYVYIGGLPFDLSEGDIITIFSQYGEPVYVNLVRDKETGKSKGFAFLKYEDQRSCDLAVDNLSGAQVMGRMLRVDHTRYKKKDEEEVADNTMAFNDGGAGDAKGKDQDMESESEEERRPQLREEKELAELLRTQDDDDPMKAYLVQQKKEEVEEAVKAWKARNSKSKKGDDGRRHRHHRSHRDDVDERRRRRRHRSRSPTEQRSRSRERKRDYSEERDRRTKRRDYPEERDKRDRRRDRSGGRQERTAAGLL